MSELNFLSAAEAAKLYKVSPVTLRRLARAGKIPAVKLGRVWRFPSPLIGGAAALVGAV